MKSIGYGAFSHTNISSITIPEGVTTIGNRCFYECSSLKNIELPTTLISIGDNAFSTHSTFNIETKIVKMKVNSRIENTFHRITSITSINIPSGVTSIGNGCFEGCCSMRSISLPTTLINIGNDAFSNTGITSIINRKE